MSKVIWDSNFTPSYTPMEMLDKGVFMDCCYTAVIKGIPSKYTRHKKSPQPGDSFDAGNNYFGLKSRQSLKVWQENGWTTELSLLGWWEWYIKYFEGRRGEKEDKLQIGRWRSFVARHNAQVQLGCKPNDDECRPKQRQGLLQWAWDSHTPFNLEQKEANLARLKEVANISLESIKVPDFIKW